MNKLEKFGVLAGVALACSIGAPAFADTSLLQSNLSGISSVKYGTGGFVGYVNGSGGTNSFLGSTSTDVGGNIIGQVAGREGVVSGGVYSISLAETGFNAATVFSNASAGGRVDVKSGSGSTQTSASAAADAFKAFMPYFH